MNKKKILILVNSLSFFVSHRLDIAFAAKKKGYDVKIGYGELGNTKISILLEKNIECFQVPLVRGSINPIKELWSLISILRIFFKLKPEIVHLITIKAYLYGGISARLVKVPAVLSSVAGLGILFNQKKWWNILIQKLLRPIFYLAFNHPNQRVIVQNTEDRKTLTTWAGVDPKKFLLINGSGVNLSKFKNLDNLNDTVTVCFASRLLRDKGVFDYISAAKIIKTRGIKAKFLLAGSLDLSNPNSITENELNIIIKEKIVDVLGYESDMPSLYARSDIVCLPSYYGEGLPKCLIEGAAARRAIVTTDIAGCRDAIIPNKTGLLVPIKNPLKLADALQRLIENPLERIAMGKAGRNFAEKEFPIEKIVKSHINIYQDLLKKKF